MKIDCCVTLGVDREFDWLAPELLRAMDTCQVERAVITAVDRCLAVDNRTGNDFLLQQVRLHPGRLLASCSANPWFGPDAVNECRRAIGEGARLLVLHPFLQGFLADDELVWPLLELAEREKIPVYMHTGNPGNSTPWQLVSLARRCPQLDLIMGHSGSTDFWNDVNDAASAAPNIYIETSLARPFSIPGRIQALGPGKVIMGSFAPVNDFCFEWDQMTRVLPPEFHTAVLGGNLQRLLEKRGAL